MNNAWQRYAESATGLTQVTRQRAENIIKGLVKQGEVAADRAEKAIDDLMNRSERNRKALATLVRSETERAVERLGLARQRDVDQLRSKVEKLEAEVRRGSTAKKATKKKAAKKSAKKTAAAKRTSAKKQSP